MLVQSPGDLCPFPSKGGRDLRIEGWNPNKFDVEFDTVTRDRLMKAAKIVKAAVRRRCPVGTVTRPMYRSGPYAGTEWTARDGGALRKSVRVVEKKTKTGRISKKKNVRVYVGNHFAYYADIVEFSRPFMRPAWAETQHIVESIIGIGESIGAGTGSERM